jgi:uncharacterized protein Yka (UPF0111/DUF47 family)
MNIDSFLKFFVPKDHSFFPLFEAAAQNLVKASELLVELMSSTEIVEHERINKEIKDIEHIGDEITDKTYVQLNKSFITPFDRVKAIEHEADELYFRGVSELFEKEEDPKELLKNNKILEILERCVDEEKDVTDTLKAILIKMA